MTRRRPLGNVLVATDFSAGATRAVQRAGRLPLARGATLTILHVCAPGHEPEERQTVARALDHAGTLAAAGAKDSGARVVSRLVPGMPFVEIVRAAREGGNELVVVGRHGPRAFPDLLLGSTAERIVRKGRLSVLVVAEPPSAAYTHPLVAVDLSECSRAALELGCRLAGPSGARLDVLHAYEAMSQHAIERAGFSAEDGVEYRLHTEQCVHTAVRRFLATCGSAASATLLVRPGDACTVILDVAAERRADLLALGTHGRSGSAHVLLGSVAEAVMRAARCDVLIAVGPVPPFELP